MHTLLASLFQSKEIRLKWFNASNKNVNTLSSPFNVGGTSANGNTPQFSNGKIKKGDLLLAFITAVIASADTLVPPAGWTQIGNQYTQANGQSATCGAFYRVADGTEVPPFAFSWTNASGGGSWTLLCIENVDPQNPILASADDDLSTGNTTPQAPAVTPNHVHATLLVTFLATLGGGNPTKPSGMQQVADFGASTSSRPRIYSAIQKLVLPGSTGIRQGTWQFSTQSVAYTIALRRKH